MCGLAGFLGFSGLRAEGALSVAEKMGKAILHRGPDDAGCWLDESAQIALSHRRLSILDLSAAGHQPMHSACGRFVIAYNGEIYNHDELRHALEATGAAPVWRGHSDTEVLLAAITAWGIEKALQKATGMFALALWDREKRSLFLARDRFGEKPLYYGWQGSTFLFGSELKALRQHPSFTGELDRDALALFFRYSYIPAPHSIYRDIHKLLPGCWLELKAKHPPGFLPAPRPYWNLREIVETALENRFTGTDAEALLQLETLLSQSVARQMVADVSVGAFLSGGIDSSTIVALMQKQSSRPVKTFTIGFREKNYNEATYAKAVAQHLGTDHTELYVTPQDALDVIPRLPTIYDEPFADPSQVPTFLVSQLTRRHVTVSLSGDGGDEIFGGYNRHFLLRRIWDKLRFIPLPVRRTAVQLITAFPSSFWDRAYAVMKHLPSMPRITLPGDKVYKLAETLSARSIRDLYRGVISHEKNPTEIVLGSREADTILTQEENWPRLDSPEEEIMYLDTMSYLPDDILVKVDRAAMSVSLESRIPFLDHKVVEFAWRLPLSMKIRDGKGKWLLRQLLYKHVPENLVERPKMGFGIPLDSWLRRELRDWAEDLLDEDGLKRGGILQPSIIRRKWDEHLSGRRNWQPFLWNVLMFQSWWRSV